jgi:hypothetical protein
MMTQPSQMADVGEPVQIEVQKSDLQIRARFRTHLWTLFHNIPSLYSALLSGLGEFGVTPDRIRSDVGDGSLGAYNVNFWMLGFRALVRIRLEQLEVDFNDITKRDLDAFEQAFVRLCEALAAANPGLEFSNQTVDLGLHADTIGVQPPAYLSSFITRVPQLPNAVGSTVSFYFAPRDGKVIFRTLGVDLSAAMTGKLFVRIFSNYDGSVQPTNLRAVVESDVISGIAALGLRSMGS